MTPAASAAAVESLRLELMALGTQLFKHCPALLEREKKTVRAAGIEPLTSRRTARPDLAVPCLSMGDCACHA